MMINCIKFLKKSALMKDQNLGLSDTNRWVLFKAGVLMHV